jgi:nitroreductase
MELSEVVRRRRMTRAFTDAPVASDVLDRLLDAGRRAPTAGFSQGVEVLVLEGPTQTERFWSCTFDAATRETFRWQGLFRAPVLVVPFASAEAYLRRYAESDKATTGLGEGVERWPVPFWLTDAAMAAENILLAAVDERLGALFFGIFSGEEALRAEFGVPEAYRPIGAIALGHPAPDEPGRSAGRPRKALAEFVHRGSW